MHQKYIQSISKSVFILSGIFTLLVLISVVGYIMINSIHVIDFDFLLSLPKDSGKSGGIFPMVLSSVYLIVISSFISVPIGVGSAIYITQYCSNKHLMIFINLISQILSSIPSIVFGLFGLAFLVFYLNLGWSIVSAGVVLALMSIPTIFQVSVVALGNVSRSYKEGCYALGATKWQCINSVVIPIALPGIFTGIILAITRAISEAAAVMYVVGSSVDMPTSVLDAGRPLPLHLYVLATEGISMSNAFGTAAVLVMLVLSITVISNLFINRFQNHVMGV